MATIGTKDSTAELLSAQGKEGEKAEKAEKNEEAEKEEEEEEAQTTIEESDASNQTQINDKNSDYNLNHNPNHNDNDSDIINININLDISNNLVSSSSSTSSSPPPPMPDISVPFPGLNINNDIISNSDNDDDNINDNLNESINNNNIGINPAIDDHMVIMMPSSPSQAALDESSSTSSANINEDLPFFQNNSSITPNNNNNNNTDSDNNNNNNNNDSINININNDNNNIRIERPAPPAAACWPWQEAAVTPTNPILPRQHHHPAHYPVDESASVDCDVSSLYLSTCSLDQPGSMVAADRIQFEFLASGDPHNHNHDVNLNHEHDHSHSHNHDHGHHHHPRLFNSFSDISSCVTHGDACNEAASYDSVSACSNNNNNSSNSHTHHSNNNNNNNNHNGGNVYFQAANAYGGTSYMPYGMPHQHPHPHTSYLSPHVMMEQSLAVAGGHMGYGGPFAHGDPWGPPAAAQESLGSYSSSLIDLNHLTMGLPLPAHVSSLHADSPPKLSLKRHCEDVDGVLPSKRAFMGSNNMNMNTSHHAIPFNNNTKVGTSLQQQGAASNTSIKQRARQGTANDPQSIAARLRRERISERLKILQELVPNGSKVDLVTMLEKAISYVKFLQLQVKVLTTDEYWPSSTSLNKAMKTTSFSSVKAEDDLPNGGVSDAKPKKEATRA